jgi:hypothetical protein
VNRCHHRGSDQPREGERYEIGLVENEVELTGLLKRLGNVEHSFVQGIQRGTILAEAILQKNGNPLMPQSVTTASTRAPLATVSTRATIRLPPLGEVGKAGGSELHNASPTRDSPFNVVANSSTNRAILRDCALLTGWIAKKVAGSGSNGSSTVTSRPAAM